jgi:hypothetical protein
MDKKKVWHVSLERRARLKGVKQKVKCVLASSRSHVWLYYSLFLFNNVDNILIVFLVSLN